MKHEGKLTEGMRDSETSVWDCVWGSGSERGDEKRGKKRKAERG